MPATDFFKANVAVNDNSAGSRIWQNLNNAVNYGGGTSSVYCPPGDTIYSNWLKLTAFGHAVPSDQEIFGIELRMRRGVYGPASQLVVTLERVELVVGGVIRNDQSSLCKDSQAWAIGYPADYEIVTMGVADDYPGRGTGAIHPADVNAADFGVALQVKCVSSDTNWQGASVDYVEAKLHYGPPASTITDNSEIVAPVFIQ